jgi:DnaJ family protein C protein 2
MIPEDFFKTFAAVFHRNMRFSKKLGAPEFGDDSSKREDINKFYSFWDNFQSWRDFS